MKVRVTFVTTQEVDLPNKYFERAKCCDDLQYLSEYQMTDKGLHQVERFYPTVTCVDDMNGKTIAEY